MGGEEEEEAPRALAQPQNPGSPRQLRKGYRLSPAPVGLPARALAPAPPSPSRAPCGAARAGRWPGRSLRRQGRALPGGGWGGGGGTGPVRGG